MRSSLALVTVRVTHDAERSGFNPSPNDKVYSIYSDLSHGDHDSIAGLNAVGLHHTLMLLLPQNHLPSIAELELEKGRGFRNG